MSVPTDSQMLVHTDNQMSVRTDNQLSVLTDNHMSVPQPLVLIYRGSKYRRVRNIAKSDY